MAHRGGVHLVGEEEAGRVDALRGDVCNVGCTPFKAGRVAGHCQLTVVCHTLWQRGILCWS